MQERVIWRISYSLRLGYEKQMRFPTPFTTENTRERSAEAEKKPTDAHNNVRNISDVTS
jgi:hypothetical protein